MTKKIINSPGSVSVTPMFSSNAKSTSDTKSSSYATSAAGDLKNSTQSTSAGILKVAPLSTAPELATSTHQEEAEVIEDDGDEEWEDEPDSDVDVNRMQQETFMTAMALDIGNVIRVAEQNNQLLHMMMSHPQLNRSNPPASPKPLFDAIDFARRTYLEYIMPLLPKDAEYKSSRIANGYLFEYSPDFPDKPPRPPFPANVGLAEGDHWLYNLTNWPEKRESKKYAEMFEDAFTRTMTISLSITNPIKGVMEPFDWEDPLPIKQMAAQIMQK